MTMRSNRLSLAGRLAISACAWASFAACAWAQVEVPGYETKPPPKTPATQPATTQPATTQPAATQPVKPATTQPATRPTTLPLLPLAHVRDAVVVRSNVQRAVPAVMFAASFKNVYFGTLQYLPAIKRVVP